VRSLLDRCADLQAGAHPSFGRLSGREWGILVYKHTDHRLRQFGV
jgi:hypothetical protein